MVGILQSIDGHQTAHGQAVALGNAGEILPGLDHVLASPLAVAGGAVSGAGAGHRTCFDPQGAAGFHMVGVAEIVQPHQFINAHAMAIGNLRKGFAVLDGHLGGLRG